MKRECEDSELMGERERKRERDTLKAVTVTTL